MIAPTSIATTEQKELARAEELRLRLYASARLGRWSYRCRRLAFSGSTPRVLADRDDRLSVRLVPVAEGSSVFGSRPTARAPAVSVTATSE